MKRAWLTKFLLPCLPGMVLAGFGALLGYVGQCCWTPRRYPLSEAVDEVETFTVLLSYCTGSMGFLVMLGTFVVGVGGLVWAGIKRKQFSPVGFGLLVLSLGLFAFKYLSRCSLEAQEICAYTIQ